MTVLGSLIEVPQLRGKWSVWSAAPGPSQVFAVPADEAARSTGRTFITVKIVNRRDGRREITLQQ